MPRPDRTLPFVALIAASLLISGCATTTSTAPSPSAPSSTTAPSSTPTPTPEVVRTPTLPFDGDCAPLLSAADLDGFLGEGWMTRDEMSEQSDVDLRHPAFALTPLASIGGVECWWYPAEDEDGLQQISVMVAPADSVPSSFTEEFSEARCEGNYDGSSCYLARTQGDAWLMATVGNLITDPPVAMLEGMLDAAAAHLPEPLDAASVSRDGWWTLPTCEEFGADMRLGELIGEDYLTGFWEGTESPELIMLREGGVAVLCQWSTTTSPDGEIYTPSIHLANGAHWQWADLAALEGAEEVSVDGAASAILVGDPDSARTLFATDGVNVIKADSAAPELLVELTERALAALG